MTPILEIFYSLSQVLENIATATGLKAKVGRKPKVNDWEIASAKVLPTKYGYLYPLLPHI